MLSTLLYALGGLYSQKQDYSKSIEYFRKFITFYPNNYHAYNSLGNALKADKKYDEAFKNIYRALELNPKDPFSTGTLAEIYTGVNNDDEFFRNLELSFSLGMSKKDFERILKEETVYKSYFNNERFLKLVTKYYMNIEIPDK
jgi:tetratricopeptide (TPR) repeat protein